MQRRCPLPLPEVEALAGYRGDGEGDAAVVLDAGQADGARLEAARRLAEATQDKRLRLRLREVTRLLEERAVTAQRDQRPPGRGNPHLCPWLEAQARPEAAWLGVVRLGGWGEVLPLGADPLQDPARYVDAAAVITSARARSIREQEAREEPPARRPDKGGARNGHR